MQVKFVAKSCAVSMLLLAGIALADEVLSKDFLDYLAEFETEDGEWIDPEELEDMAQLGEENSNGESDD